MAKGIEIFTLLAEDYARYRPGYPAEVLDTLASACGLTSDWVIADIGSGTGNLARLFLAAGNQVIGVEPNREMREAAERLLSACTTFRSVDGTAERIPLDAHSVDMVTAGQAIHWFDADKARAEFRRILRPGGWVAVVWNDGCAEETPFTREYSAFTRASAHASAYTVPSLSAGLDRLLADAPHSAEFPHTQSLDLDGFLGRVRSSGYIPQPGEPSHIEITALMTDLFARHQQAGTIEFHYIARLFFGRLEESDYTPSGDTIAGKG